MTKVNKEAAKKLEQINETIRSTMAELLKNRKEKENILPISMSRLNGLCRRDGRNLKPYVSEFFMLWDLWDRNMKLLEPIEEYMQIYIVNLKAQEAKDRDNIQRDLVAALRDLAGCLDEYLEARKEDSEGGAKITKNEYGNIMELLGPVMHKLFAFQKKLEKEVNQES